jgi:hypothetical protein
VGRCDDLFFDLRGLFPVLWYDRLAISKVGEYECYMVE